MKTPTKRLAALLSAGALLAVASAGIALPASATESATKTLTWQLPAEGTWPQTPFNAGAVPCGTTVRTQTDVYRYGTPEEQARTDALDDDGILERREDARVVLSWSLGEYTAPDCAVVPPVEPPVEQPPVSVPETPAAPVVKSAPPVTRELAVTGAKDVGLWPLVGAGLLALGGLLFFRRKPV